MRASRVHWSIVGIFLILVIHTLSWAGEFLIPITAALLGFLVILPVERKLSRMGVPSSATAAVFCLGLTALVVFVAISVAGPVANLIEDLPGMVRQMRIELAGMGGDTIDKIKDAAEAAEQVVEGETVALKVRVDNSGDYIGRILMGAPSFAVQMVLTMVLMFFLISSGSSFLRKLVEVTPSFRDRRTRVSVVNQVAQRLGVYLGGITMINAGLGVAIGLAMWAWGVPNAAMFAFIGFAFNYVPYLGAVAGAALAGIVAFSEMNDLWTAVLVFATYMTLTSIEGQLVTPYVISGRLKLNPTVVFIAVAFFAWIWSVIGMVVAVPILIAFKIIFDEYPATRPIGLFLGGEDDRLAKPDEDEVKTPA